jgi:hypothetical protein
MTIPSTAVNRGPFSFRFDPPAGTLTVTGKVRVTLDHPIRETPLAIR